MEKKAAALVRKTAKTPPKGGVKLYALRGEVVPQFLGDRPIDHRVLYATAVNRGKIYPRQELRETDRRLRQIAAGSLRIANGLVAS